MHCTATYLVLASVPLSLPQLGWSILWGPGVGQYFRIIGSLGRLECFRNGRERKKQRTGDSSTCDRESHKMCTKTYARFCDGIGRLDRRWHMDRTTWLSFSRKWWLSHDTNNSTSKPCQRQRALWWGDVRQGGHGCRQEKKTSHDT